MCLKYISYYYVLKVSLDIEIGMNLEGHLAGVIKKLIWLCKVIWLCKQTVLIIGYGKKKSLLVPWHIKKNSLFCKRYKIDLEFFRGWKEGSGFQDRMGTENYWKRVAEKDFSNWRYVI